MRLSIFNYSIRKNEGQEHGFPRRARGAVLLALAGLLLLPALALAKMPGQEHFTKTLTVEDAGTLTLQSTALLRYWGFPIYYAALYTPSDPPTAETLLDAGTTKRLELYYLRQLKKEDIVEATEEALDQNPEASREALAERLDRTYSIYRNVDKGDRFSMTWIPEKGMRLEVNGKSAGLIDGADFMRAYMGIWLSRHSFVPALRDKLWEGLSPSGQADAGGGA